MRGGGVHYLIFESLKCCPRFRCPFQFLPSILVKELIQWFCKVSPSRDPTLYIRKCPKGLAKHVTVVGNGVLICSLLASLIENIPSPITCPKNSICLTPKVHFSGLRSIPTSRILWRTFRNRWRCSNLAIFSSCYNYRGCPCACRLLY